MSKKPQDDGRSSMIASTNERGEDATASAGASPPAKASATTSATTLPVHPAPEYLVFHKNPDKDDVGFKAVLEGITNTQTVSYVHSSFRTVAFVSFPLLTLSIHPNTMYRLGFPQLLVAAVISTSTHRPTLGEQIGLHSWIWRGIIYMLIYGTVVDVWQVQRHIGAWYGLLALGVFLAGLVSHGMTRRFMYLYFFVYMMELRMYDHYFRTLPLTNAAWSALDYFIGSLLGMAALCFPYPLLVRDLVNTIMGKIFEGLGKMLFAMISFSWMPDAHAACLFFDDRAPFMKIEAILEVMPPLLWFANWEPMEFPLRNPIRRLKLSLLRRLMALTYAAFGIGQTVAELRKQQADRIAVHKIFDGLYRAKQGNDRRAIAGLPGEEEVATARVAPVMSTTETIAALRANSAGYVKEFGAALLQVMILTGSAMNTPELLVKNVPFDVLREKDTLMRRNLRLETLQVMKIQSELVARRRAEQQSEGNQWSGQEEENEESLPFGGSSDTRHRPGRTDARMLLAHRDIIEDSEVFIRINEIFLHMLLSMIAGELLNFGEEMKDYRPPMSLGRRLLQYFLVEPWNDFWEELWCRVSFARPCDYRTVKDAIRMTCAYLTATALNLELYVIPGGLYFFGVTILLGLPVEEESLNMGVNRMAGNSLGCALGYLAYHNGNNLAQVLAMTLCFTFVQQCCKNHPLYGQTFFYGSIITMAGMATATVTMELLTRMIASMYTIMAYMLCCMFIFPNNCIKICWGYRCKLAKVMSEVVDDVALTLRHPVACQAATSNEEDGNGEPVEYPKHNTEVMQMCSQLNVQMSLADVLLSMCDKWAPFAARQPVIRGSAPFPAAASTMVGFSHKRMVANLRLLVFGAQLLHRPRCNPVSENLARILYGSIADFLTDFADCMRLLSQDFIDSVQLSRTWSYPLSLSRTSQMSRLQVRLRAIHYECYVIMTNYMSRGTFGMTQDDFEVLRLEASEHQAAENAGHRGQIEVLAGSAADDALEGANPLARNRSFADRFLSARRIADDIFRDGPHADAADAAVMKELHDSIYLPTPQGSAMLGAERPRAFSYRAHLAESVVAPKDAFPLTQESAEVQVQHRLRAEKVAEARKAGPATEGESIEPRTTTFEGKGADRTEVDPSSESPYAPMVPRKTKSNVSKLILFPDHGPETYIPLYRGPAFTFVEDKLATDKDTDFSAIIAVLCSCDSLITELKGLTGPVNSINGYQKQLHESSFALSFIDRLSAKVKSIRKENYDRYHIPAPPQQRRDPLHAQPDPWKDWRF